jgi:hypothetical protein
MDVGLDRLPQSRPEGLVDPMKTKLEMMAGYLAGRRDESADLVRQELGDPASEACRFLEAMREKSRAALGVDPPGRPDPGPAPRGPIARALPGPARLPVTVLALVVSPVLIAVGAAWWAQDQRLRGIEASLSRGDEGREDRVRRLERAVARGGNATESALDRQEAALGKLERRLGEDRASRLDPDDPTVDRLRRDLDGLRQDLGARERADRQDLQGLRSALEEAQRSLRRLEARPPAQPPVRVPVPILIPMPAQGHGPGLEQHDPDGGHPSQGSELQSRPPGDRRGPPARTSGGPGY